MMANCCSSELGGADSEFDEGLGSRWPPRVLAWRVCAFSTTIMEILLSRIQISFGRIERGSLSPDSPSVFTVRSQGNRVILATRGSATGMQTLKEQHRIYPSLSSPTRRKHRKLISPFPYRNNDSILLSLRSKNLSIQLLYSHARIILSTLHLRLPS